MTSDALLPRPPWTRRDSAADVRAFFARTESASSLAWRSDWSCATCARNLVISSLGSTSISRGVTCGGHDGGCSDASKRRTSKSRNPFFNFSSVCLDFLGSAHLILCSRQLFLYSGNVLETQIEALPHGAHSCVDPCLLEGGFQRFGIGSFSPNTFKAASNLPTRADASATRCSGCIGFGLSSSCCTSHWTVPAPKPAMRLRDEPPWTDTEPSEELATGFGLPFPLPCPFVAMGHLTDGCRGPFVFEQSHSSRACLSLHQTPPWTDLNFRLWLTQNRETVPTRTLSELGILL